MQELMITLGASLVLALTMSAADARKPDRANEANPPSWNNTSPPGFAQGDKSWQNSTPPGWTKKKGKRNGWNGQSTPPGLYKRQ